MSENLAVIPKQYQNMDKIALINEVVKLKNSIANLGDGQVFVKRTKTGIMKAVKQAVTLKESLSEIQTIQKKTMITAAGANKLNQTPGLNVVTPPFVVVDGEQRSNPYIEKHSKTKVIQSVYVRKVVFGPNPIGNMVGIDYTLFFNIHTYFLQDIQAKIKKFPAVGFIGKNIDGKPQDSYLHTPVKWTQGKPVDQQPKKLKTDHGDWNFYQLDDAGLHPVGIWVDISHKEFQSCLDSHVQRQKFGDRHAQSICTRNALLKHPAIAAQSVLTQGTNKNKDDKNFTAKINVYGFLHDFDVHKVSKMAEDVSNGTVDPGTISISQEFTEADYSEVQVTEKNEGDEFGATSEQESDDIPDLVKTGQKPPDEINPKEAAERENLLAAIWEHRESKGDKCFFAKLEQLKKSKGEKTIKWPVGYSNTDLAELLILLSKEEGK